MKNRIFKYLSFIFFAIGLSFFVGCDNETKPNDEVFDITIPNVSNGIITANATKINKGDKLELTINPAANYQLESLKANGNDLIVTNNKAKIDNVTENITISASFIGVEVTVNFIVDNKTFETKKVQFNSAYQILPAYEVEKGYQFNGWYTEPNGGGTLVTADTIVANGNNHSLYAHITTIPLQVNVTGIVDTLFHYPNAESEEMILSISVLENNVDVTDSVQISLKSSDEKILVIDGTKVKIASQANGTAELFVLVNGVVCKNYTINAVDYDGLGFTAVSSKEEFLSMTNNNKYVLTCDIDLENAWLVDSDGDWSSRIQILSSDSIIDGAGHIVRNAKLGSGWNKGWIGTLSGTVRNIVFLNIDSPDMYPYSTGLIGTGECGTIENVYLQLNVICDGDSTDIYTKGGGLIGTLNTGNIKDCVVDFIVKNDLSIYNYGALVGLASNFSGSITNSYAIVHNSGVEAYGAEKETNVWTTNVKNNSVEVFDSVYSFLNSISKNNLFNSNWEFSLESLKVFGTEVLVAEDSISVDIQDEFEFGLSEESIYIDFIVYRYGEASKDYTATFTSSNEQVFTTTRDGGIIFKGIGSAILTIVIDEKVTLTTNITIFDDSQIGDDDVMNILLIGNSYGEDSFNWLYNIASNQNIEVRLGVLYYGGCSIEQHINFANSSSGVYTYYKNTTGRWVTKTNQTMQYALADEKWDKIVIQQQSLLSTDQASYTKLPELLSIIKENVSSNPLFYWNMIWAYKDGAIVSGFDKFNYEQIKMYEAITSTTKSIILPYSTDGVSFTEVIPVGTAIQNSRLSLNDDLMRDKIHLSLDLGRLIAAITCAKVLLDIDLDNYSLLSYSCNQMGFTTDNTFTITEQQLQTIKDSVSNAISKPYSLTYLPDQELALYLNVDSITLDKNNMPTYSLYTKVFKYGVEDANYNISYSTANEDVATVSDSGVISAVDEGTTEITIKAGTVTKVVNVTVRLPQQITDLESLKTALATNPTGSFVLSCDIDCDGETLPRISKFSGTLDGNGYAIKNARFSSSWNSSLIITLENGGIIKNLSFIGLKATKETVGAGIVSICNGTLENLYIEIEWTKDCDGSTDHYQTSGSLVSVAGSGCVISNCIVKVTGSGTFAYVASIAGYNVSGSSIIKNCLVLLNSKIVSMPEVALEKTGSSGTSFESVKTFTSKELLLSSEIFNSFSESVWKYKNNKLYFFEQEILS